MSFWPKKLSNRSYFARGLHKWRSYEITNQNAFFHQGRAKTSLNQRIIEIKKKITEMEQLFLRVMDETEAKSIYTMKKLSNTSVKIRGWYVVWRG